MQPLEGISQIHSVYGPKATTVQANSVVTYCAKLNRRGSYCLDLAGALTLNLKGLRLCGRVGA